MVAERTPLSLFRRLWRRGRRVLDWRSEARYAFAASMALTERRPPRWASTDERPWEHPFLTRANLARFRAYSEDVWRVAREHDERRAEPLDGAFVVNMAQNMYKWAELSGRVGIQPTLFPHPWDRSAVNQPEWEEFDGTWADPMDAEGFLARHSDLRLRVPVRRVPMDGAEATAAREAFAGGDRRSMLRLVSRAPTVRWDVLFGVPALASYYAWAEALTAFDVIYAASIPIPAYLSGRPYLVFAVGGDLTYDCGRADAHGELMSLAFAAARFLTVSNPHALGHSRRLGFENGVYLPYPMDDDRYSPGWGRSRAEWEARLGPGTWVLTTARIDAKWKGNDASHFEALREAARREPSLRFALVAWGEDRWAYERRIREAGAGDRFLLVPPAGKARLIDYYRSCDVVLDQMAMGYYGATALEAASVGCPIVSRLRTEHYEPLYAGDVMPAVNVQDAAAMGRALCELAERPEGRAEIGRRTRDWLVRNHGRERTAPLLRALLRMAADDVPPSTELENPLRRPLEPEEDAYHASRRVRYRR